MSTSFNIDYEWLPNEHDDAAERATLAELTINVGEFCATEVEDVFAKTVRSSARLSALRLAEWLAFHWWRLLWEPTADTYAWRASHKVGNAGGGYVWPDLSFSSDWQSVLVRTRATTRCEAEPIRYLNTSDTFVSVRDFEKGMDRFINGTIARLTSTTKAQSDLSMFWNEVVHERRDPDRSGQRALEACMGYDPDEAPSRLLDSLQEQMASYGTSAIREAAAASREQTISHVENLWAAARKSDMTVCVPHTDDIRQRLDTASGHTDVPWQRAERAAWIAREVWDLDVPIATNRLADLFSIRRQRFSDELPIGQKPLAAGFRNPDTPDTLRFSWNRNHPTSRRFALARLVADHLIAPAADRLLPATRCVTSRQKFQRAFAQEFLCPFDALRAHFGAETPSGDAMDDAARHFNVSPLMIQTILVNKGVLEPEQK